MNSGAGARARERPSFTGTHKFAMQGLPTIEGWLDKQGGVRKSWKRRYFVLDGKKLKYFKQQKDAPSKPIDFILLDVRRSFLVQAATSCFQSLKIGANRTIVLRFFISLIAHSCHSARPRLSTFGTRSAPPILRRAAALPWKHLLVRPPFIYLSLFFVHLFYLFVNSCASVPKALRTTRVRPFCDR